MDKIKKIIGATSVTAIMLGVSALPSFANYDYSNNSNANQYMNNAGWNNNNDHMMNRNMNYMMNRSRNYSYSQYNGSNEYQSQSTVYWNSGYTMRKNNHMVVVYPVMNNNNSGQCWYDNNQWNYQWDR